MKLTIGFLILVASGLLGITVCETKKLNSAYRELDRSMALNAHVNAALIKLQRQQLAALAQVQK